MITFKSVVIFLVAVRSGFAQRSAFDLELYDSVLDSELCQRQLSILQTDALLLRFIDSSGKLPNGILSGNVNDLGDYYQCLGISETINGTLIEGKYSTIFVSTDTLPSLPEVPQWPEWLPELPANFTFPQWPFNFTTPLPDGTDESTPDEGAEESRIRRESFNLQQLARMMVAGVKPVEIENDVAETRAFPMLINAGGGPVLGICIPRACTSQEAISTIIPFNVTISQYYYRLPNDKPYVPSDYVAMAILALIAFLALTNTAYDLHCTFGNPRRPNKLLTSFSVYTNTRRFLTFHPVPNALECVDGIRAISMMWVVVGHTYSVTLIGFIHNITEALEWLRLFSSTWVNSAPLTVDTFFMLSGILCVYSTIGKISRARFIRSIHLFYINRLLRMFPLLAMVILLQVSLLNHVSDGPFWQGVAATTQTCRQYWWSALLHIQNFVNPTDTCLAHSWYLSVDTQLYIVCPLILVWMFGHPRMAWTALVLILGLSIASVSIYSFTYNFSAALLHPNRITEFGDYLQYYYFNTLTRAPPFFIGMVYGYILHLHRGRQLHIPKILVVAFWLLAFALMIFCIFSIFPVMQLDWEYQAFDNFLNAYVRSMWTVAVGWVILACVHGYGGPVNWFLSLRMWKLPARLSYAMYCIHLPIMIIANSSWTQTHYFTNGDNLYRFCSDLLITFVSAFILCIFVDAPFSTLQKLLMNAGKRKPQEKEKKESLDSLDVIEKTSL